MTRIADALIGWALMPLALAAAAAVLFTLSTLRLLDPYR